MKKKFIALFFTILIVFALYYMIQNNKSMNKGVEDEVLTQGEINIEDAESVTEGSDVNDSNLDDLPKYEMKCYANRAYGREIITEVFYNNYNVKMQTEDLAEGEIGEGAHINYPVITVCDNKEVENKINDICYEISTDYLDDELKNEANAFYSGTYYITYSDEEYISIHFGGSRSSGYGTNRYEYAVTLNLLTGEEMALKEFSVTQDDVCDFMKKAFINEETDTYSYFRENHATDWDMQFSKWINIEDIHYYDYFLMEDAVGILIPFNLGTRDNMVIELYIYETLYEEGSKERKSREDDHENVDIQKDEEIQHVIVKPAYKTENERVTDVNYNNYSVEMHTQYLEEGNFKEGSRIEYPVLTLEDNQIVEDKINKTWYELSVQELDPELKNRVSAEYIAFYDITYFNADYISIHFRGSKAAPPSVDTYEHAVTLDLVTGEIINLEDFSIMEEDIEEIIKVAEYYGGSGILDAFKSTWEKRKKYAGWNLKDNHIYDYFITDDGIGILFSYLGARSRSDIAIEIPFEEIVYARNNGS